MTHIRHWRKSSQPFLIGSLHCIMYRQSHRQALPQAARGLQERSLYIVVRMLRTRFKDLAHCIPRPVCTGPHQTSSIHSHPEKLPVCTSCNVQLRHPTTATACSNGPKHTLPAALKLYMYAAACVATQKTLLEPTSHSWGTALQTQLSPASQRSLFSSNHCHDSVFSVLCRHLDDSIATNMPDHL
jgi:transposase-like protein